MTLLTVMIEDKESVEATDIMISGCIELVIVRVTSNCSVEQKLFVIQVLVQHMVEFCHCNIKFNILLK